MLDGVINPSITPLPRQLPVPLPWATIRPIDASRNSTSRKSKAGSAEPLRFERGLRSGPTRFTARYTVLSLGCLVGAHLVNPWDSVAYQGIYAPVLLHEVATPVEAVRRGLGGPVKKR